MHYQPFGGKPKKIGFRLIVIFLFGGNGPTLYCGKKYQHKYSPFLFMNKSESIRKHNKGFNCTCCNEWTAKKHSEEVSLKMMWFSKGISDLHTF